VYQDPHRHEGSFQLHHGDLNDAHGLRRILDRVRPHEVYHLGAQSHVRVSFDIPLYTAETVAMGSLRLLEAVREYQECSGAQVRYYHASSSEQFGKVLEVPQRETTPFYPRSPYGCAKAMSHYATVNYRESYGMHASCGILFNHESPRRGETFVSRKITRAVGRIHHGLQAELYLGNLDAKRDWGFAGDYVDAMWRMLQQEEPGDYVIATGRTHTVREFVELAFGAVGLDYTDHVRFDERYLRPAEVDFLIGDPSKARQNLGWEPTVSFVDLIQRMVEADLKLAEQERRFGTRAPEPVANVSC
jgi:GDPmannose 4,6-dehydratase